MVGKAHGAVRFTPTCVGKSLNSPDLSINACGRFTPTCVGKRLFLCRWMSALGSPPRAWGRAPQAEEAHLDGRFTPTCVGKRTSTRLERAPVHPHVRGDEAARRYPALHRFTPTCVGKRLNCVNVDALLRPLLFIPLTVLRDQRETFEVPKATPRAPGLAPSEPARAIRRPKHCGPSRTNPLFNPGPELFPHSRRRVPHECPLLRLYQPSRQRALQARRRLLQEDHQHRTPARYPEGFVGLSLPVE